MKIYKYLTIKRELNRQRIDLKTLKKLKLTEFVDDRQEVHKISLNKVIQLMLLLNCNFEDVVDIDKINYHFKKQRLNKEFEFNRICVNFFKDLIPMFQLKGYGLEKIDRELLKIKEKFAQHKFDKILKINAYEVEDLLFHWDKYCEIVRIKFYDK